MTLPTLPGPLKTPLQLCASILQLPQLCQKKRQICNLFVGLFVVYESNGFQILSLLMRVFSVQYELY